MGPVCKESSQLLRSSRKHYDYEYDWSRTKANPNINYNSPLKVHLPVYYLYILRIHLKHQSGEATSNSHHTQANLARTSGRHRARHHSPSRRHGHANSSRHRARAHRHASHGSIHRLRDDIVLSAHGILSQRALRLGADSLQRGGLLRDDLHLRAAFCTEEGIESGTNSLDVGSSHAKGLCGQSDLGDEIPDLGGAKSHELVGFVHGVGAIVGGEALLRVHAALKEGAEIGVEVG